MIEGSGSIPLTKWIPIRIREAQKHEDPVDPDHCPQPCLQVKTTKSHLLIVPAVKSWPGAEEEEEERIDFAPATVTSSSKLEDKDPSKHPMPFLNLILTAGLLDHDLVTMKLKKIYLFTNLIYLDGMLKS
jgi:hypothetical protein